MKAVAVAEAKISQDAQKKGKELERGNGLLAVKLNDRTQDLREKIEDSQSPDLQEQINVASQIEKHKTEIIDNLKSKLLKELEEIIDQREQNYASKQDIEELENDLEEFSDLVVKIAHKSINNNTSQDSASFGGR